MWPLGIGVGAEKKDGRKKWGQGHQRKGGRKKKFTRPSSMESKKMKKKKESERREFGRDERRVRRPQANNFS